MSDILEYIVDLTFGGVYSYDFSGFGGAGGNGNGIGFGRAVSPSTMFTKQYSINAINTKLCRKTYKPM